MKLLCPTLLLLAFLAACQPKPQDPQPPAPLTLPRVERTDAALDKLIPADAQVETLAEGFQWGEGPVWLPGGYVVFTDVPANTMYKWKEGEGKSVYLTPSGYTGPDAGREGANGLLLDAQGRLVLCQHGDRRVAYMDAPLDAPKAQFVTLADRYQGKRFNSPNDAVFDKQGNLYFTDPPYGLPKDTAQEIAFQGVYRRNLNGSVDLIYQDLSRPNGIAFSPDQKTLYAANSDPDRAIWMAWDIDAAGATSNGRVFYDATPSSKAGDAGLPDGMKVDTSGNIYATGPGGVWIFSAEGKVLGKILLPEACANCAIGGGHLYITADDHLYRVKLN